ncbi:MAG: hypothetical protein JW910_21285 [Anaerolineae bacterium]|nr:hypothetical protein [Anaerolineae bacterium]
MCIKRLCAVLLIMVLALPALAVVPFAGAQEGPPRVGLRPDAPRYALHGPYWVGTRTIDANTGERPTKVLLWYPAVNPTGAEEAITYGAPIVGHALGGATPDLAHGPYPLVIFAHGMNGTPPEASYLTEHLASHGFVVMAMAFADNMAQPMEMLPLSAFIMRPRDVSWLIDYATTLNATEGDFAGMIVIDRVAVTGHSLGGYTTFAAGGARWTAPLSADDWCTVYPDTTMPPEFGSFKLCDPSPGIAEWFFNEVAALFSLESMPTDLYPSLGDPRIDAIVPLAPGMDFFGGAGTASVTVPTMVLVGSHDRFVFSYYDKYLPWVYENLGSDLKSLVVFDGADHFVFPRDCDSMLSGPGAEYFWVCSDPVWDMDRAHDLTNHFATAFLLAVLKGDAEAAAALTPDAVNFPGITYEVQGF